MTNSRRETDSLAEGERFEPSVLREGNDAHETARFDHFGTSLRPQIPTG
jgi:hypothetical protein